MRQELVLGIGGWRVLRALGLQPEVCHLNEGHAAFAVLERARSYMEDNGKPFDVALAVTRPGNLFTTHTAVEAGFDRFAPSLIERYLRKYAEEKLSISFDELLALGRRDRQDSIRTVQYGLFGDPRQRRHQRRQQTARSGEPTTLPAPLSQVA